MPISSCLSLTPLMLMPLPVLMLSMSLSQLCALRVQASAIRQLPRRWLPVSSSCSPLAVRVTVECDSRSTAICLALLTNAR